MSIAFGPGISCGRPNLLECGLPEFGPVAIQAVPGQTGDQLRILDSSSNIVGGFDLNGNLLGAAASPSGSVILAPSSANRNLIQPTANGVKGLSVKAKLGGGAAIFDCQDSLGNQIIRVADSSVDNALTITPPDDNLPFGITLIAGASSPYFFCQTTNGNAWRVNSDASYEAFCASDLGTVDAFKMTPTLTDPAHATTKSRVTIQTFDGNFGANARTNLILEADGTAARIGFLGAAAAVRQATASAAGIAGIRTDTLANAVADITVILTALRAWGVTFGLTANTA